MNLNFTGVLPSVPYILQGITVTLKVIIISALLGFSIGVILALFKIGRIKVLVWIADVYTSIFRGTPLVLQLLIIYYGLPQIIGFDIPPYWAAVISFGLNSGAYISEVIRGGILSVDKGQSEAAEALSIPYTKSMKDIILPQAMKNILPALMNEFISLTKDSALVTTIGVMDIMRRSYVVGGDTYSYFEPLIIAGLIYYIMIIILTSLGKGIERRMSVSD